jgi:hypothetical protein
MDPLVERQFKIALPEILNDWLADDWTDGPASDPTPEQAEAVQWLQHEREKPAAQYAQQVLPLILGSLQSATRGEDR